MQLMRPLLRAHRPIVYECEPGVMVSGDIDDVVVAWGFAGEYQRDRAFQFSLSLLRPGDVVFDIGANVGLWSLSASRRVGNGHVHAFEPVPQLNASLVRHLELNRVANVTSVRKALADRRGTTQFFVATHGNSGGSGLAARPGVEQPVEVDLMTLDEDRDENGVRHIDVMKVDVEGAETLVFAGGQRMLSAPDAPVVMFESQFGNTKLFGKTQSDIRRQLEGLGYRIYRFADGSLSQVVADEREEDLFALKGQHFERLPRLRNLLRT